MAQLPDDIKEGIKNLSHRTEVPTKKLVQELKQVMSEDETIQSIPNAEQKMRVGWAIVLRRYLSQRKTMDMYVRPTSIPRPRKVNSKNGKKYNCNFSCISRPINEETDKPEDPILAAGTLWENAAKNTMNLSPDKVYKTSLTINETEQGLEVGGNDATFTETKDVKIPTVKQYYEKHIKPKEDELTIDLSEMKINDRQNEVDIRVIEATVMDHQVGVNVNGEEYGNYSLTDNSLITDADSEGRFTVWAHPKEITVEKGSRVKIIGTASYDQSNKTVRWNNFFILGTEKTVPIQKKAGEKEEIDADNLLDDEPEESKEESSNEDLEDMEDEFAV